MYYSTFDGYNSNNTNDKFDSLDSLYSSTFTPLAGSSTHLDFDVIPYSQNKNDKLFGVFEDYNWKLQKKILCVLSKIINEDIEKSKSINEYLYNFESSINTLLVKVLDAVQNMDINVTNNNGCCPPSSRSQNIYTKYLQTYDSVKITSNCPESLAYYDILTSIVYNYKSNEQESQKYVGGFYNALYSLQSENMKNALDKLSKVVLTAFHNYCKKHDISCKPPLPMPSPQQLIQPLHSDHDLNKEDKEDHKNQNAKIKLMFEELSEYYNSVISKRVESVIEQRNAYLVFLIGVFKTKDSILNLISPKYSFANVRRLITEYIGV